MSRTSRFDSSRGGACDRLDLLIRSGEAGSVSGAGAGVVSCFCCSQIGCFFLVVTTVHPQFGMAGIGRMKKGPPRRITRSWVALFDILDWGAVFWRSRDKQALKAARRSNTVRRTLHI